MASLSEGCGEDDNSSLGEQDDEFDETRALQQAARAGIRLLEENAELQLEIEDLHSQQSDMQVRQNSLFRQLHETELHLDEMTKRWRQALQETQTLTSELDHVKSQMTYPLLPPTPSTDSEENHNSYFSTVTGRSARRSSCMPTVDYSLTPGQSSSKEALCTTRRPTYIDTTPRPMISSSSTQEDMEHASRNAKAETTKLLSELERRAAEAEERYVESFRESRDLMQQLHLTKKQLKSMEHIQVELEEAQDYNRLLVTQLEERERQIEALEKEREEEKEVVNSLRKTLEEYQKLSFESDALGCESGRGEVTVDMRDGVTDQATTASSGESIAYQLFAKAETELTSSMQDVLNECTHPDLDDEQTESCDGENGIDFDREESDLQARISVLETEKQESIKLIRTLRTFMRTYYELDVTQETMITDSIVGKNPADGVSDMAQSQCGSSDGNLNGEVSPDMTENALRFGALPKQIPDKERSTLYRSASARVATTGITAVKFADLEMKLKKMKVQAGIYKLQINELNHELGIVQEEKDVLVEEIDTLKLEDEKKTEEIGEMSAELDVFKKVFDSNISTGLGETGKSDVLSSTMENSDIAVPSSKESLASFFFTKYRLHDEQEKLRDVLNLLSEQMVNLKQHTSMSPMKSIEGHGKFGSFDLSPSKSPAMLGYWKRARHLELHLEVLDTFLRRVTSEWKVSRNHLSAVQTENEQLLTEVDSLQRQLEQHVGVAMPYEQVETDDVGESLLVSLSADGDGLEPSHETEQRSFGLLRRVVDSWTGDESKRMKLYDWLTNGIRGTGMRKPLYLEELTTELTTAFEKVFVPVLKKFFGMHIHIGKRLRKTVVTDLRLSVTRAGTNTGNHRSNRADFWIGDLESRRMEHDPRTYSPRHRSPRPCFT